MKNEKINNTPPSPFGFPSVNAIGQRTVREQAGTAFATPSTDAFTYNSCGEMIGSSNTQRPSLNTTYAFDGIGNRQTSQDAFGPRDYTVNTLNQYTHVGASLAAPASPTYDLDGDMLTDGMGRAFTWDAENRLIAVETDTIRVAYAYDGQSRRMRRTEFSRPNPLASWEQTTHRLYIYDGWNVIAEYTGWSANVPPALTCSYLWGLDLSGTPQGAGGVGGLLSAKEGETAKYFTFDGNGNVSEMLDDGGNVQAHYEYDPFGNTTVGIGSWANGNVWRFSTKTVDAESGLYYYGYRFYDPAFGRWPNRDPLGEIEGDNLLVFSNNAAISNIDILGLCKLGEKRITNTVFDISGTRSPKGIEDDIANFFKAQKGTQVAKTVFVIGGFVYFVSTTGVVSIPAAVVAPSVLEEGIKTYQEFQKSNPGLANILDNIASKLRNNPSGFTAVYTRVYYEVCVKDCSVQPEGTKWSNEKVSSWKKCDIYVASADLGQPPSERYLERCKKRHESEVSGK
jgi:RHS repeat-associated protein